MGGFEAVLLQYKDQLGDDPIVSYHLSDLNETLLEQNILRILEPFSRVEIAHVAELMELPLPRTQAKLSEMILDQKLNGTLDQGVGAHCFRAGAGSLHLRQRAEDDQEHLRGLGHPLRHGQAGCVRVGSLTSKGDRILS